MRKYTVFNEKPEIKRQINDDGSQVDNPKFLVNNKIFEGYTKNNEIQKLINKFTNKSGTLKAATYYLFVLGLKQLINKGDINE